MLRRTPIAVALVAASLAVIAAPVAQAATLSERAALRATAKLARQVAAAEGGVGYFAFGCTRLSRTRVDCVGAVAYGDGTACGQMVAVRLRSGHPRTQRYGFPLCDVAYDPGSQEGSGGGSSGGEGTAICAIHQSVCI